MTLRYIRLSVILKPAWLLTALMAAVAVVSAQEPFTSTLPIVVIVTDNDPSASSHLPINDSVKIGASMKIIYSEDAELFSLADTANPEHLNYNGRIAIKTRGHTSLNTDKKSYSIETRKADNVSNNNMSLMGMPKENDWVLSGLFMDNSHIRDALTYALGRRTGHYAPRTYHCELFLNGNYRGLYMLTEKIKVDKNRVNIKKMDTDDTTGDAITGGYIIKADHPDDGEPIAWSESSLIGFLDVFYINHYPKPEDIMPQQNEYLHDYFNRFERALRRSDTSSTSGYPAFIDLPSFIDYMLVCEVASNADSYQYSTFLHKDRNGKLCAGPLWDFNQAYGNDPEGRDGYDVWQFNNGSNTGSTFWNALFSRSFFRKKMKTRWLQLIDNGSLALDSTMSLIDSLSDAVVSAAARDRQRWSYNSDYSQSIDSLKNWLTMRYAWLDEQLRPANAIDNYQFSIINSQFSISPNPTSGILHIVLTPESTERMLSDGINADIFNSVGTNVAHHTSFLNNFSIDLNPLPPGIYTLRLSFADGHSLYHRIIKR